MNIIKSIINSQDKSVKGDIVSLKYRYHTTSETAYDGIPTVYYDIVLNKDNIKVGDIELRLKMDDNMYYYGHVGYSILTKYRGNHYSFEACKLLFNEAKERYEMSELYITCNPDNIASYKTLLKLNGELVEVVQVPKDHELFKRGDRMKCIFRYKIKI